MQTKLFTWVDPKFAKPKFLLSVYAQILNTIYTISTLMPNLSMYFQYIVTNAKPKSLPWI